MISLSYLLTIGTHHIDDLLEVALHEVHDPVPGGGVKILHLPRLQRQVYIVLFVRLENRNIDFQCILSVFIGVAGSFSEGGQPFCPAKIQALPAKIFSCQGGPSSQILFCHAKLLCQTVLPMGKHCR